MTKPTDCTHPDFRASVSVGRFEDTGKFMADVKVNCAACGVAMRFIALPAGLDFDRPMVSIDGEELHAPIEPAYDKSLATSARYVMPKIPNRH
jgi:hypothetical protein